jgi:hypothetical protein
VASFNRRRARLVARRETILFESLRPLSAADVIDRTPRAQQVWSRTELYFGSAKPDGTAVTDAEFAAFLDRKITPRFPDGLTLLTGFGQFRNAAGAIQKEKSFVLILFFPPQALDSNKKIQEIREAYKTAFQQESVLRADGFSVISF